MRGGDREGRGLRKVYQRDLATEKKSEESQGRDERRALWLVRNEDESVQQTESWAYFSRQ